MTGKLALIAVLAGSPFAVSISWKSIAVSRPGFFKISANYPQFRGSTVAPLANQGLTTAAGSFINDLRNQSQTDGQPRVPFEGLWKSTVASANDRVISVMVESYAFTAGAHGQTALTGFNYAIVNGKPTKLVLANMMRSRIAPEGLATQILIPRLKALPNASLVTDGTITTITAAQANNFVVTPAGITWLFSQGEMGTEADGTAHVKVTWQELDGQLSLNNL